MVFFEHLVEERILERYGEDRGEREGFCVKGISSASKSDDACQICCGFLSAEWDSFMQRSGQFYWQRAVIRHYMMI